MTTPRRFTFEEGTSRKFWEISAAGPALTVRFGRLGTDGQTQTKKFASPSAAEAEVEKLISSKLKKGYVEEAATKPTATKPTATKPAATKPVATKPAATKKLSAAELKTLARHLELGLVAKVKALVKPGVDVNVKLPSKYGGDSTPLLVAAERDSLELVELMLEAGASVTATDQYGRGPLHVTQDVAVQRRLLEAGADVNARTRKGVTPLHTAAQKGAVESVELLLTSGAEVDARDGEKHTPYIATNSRAVRQLLTKHGSRGLDETNGHALRPTSRKGKLDEVEVDDHALGADAAGNVWFAGHVGLQRWDGKALTIYEFEESFSVDRIIAGARGLLFFSTNWGIVTFDGKAWRLVSSTDSELHDNHITDFAVDRRGVAYALGYGAEETVDRPISRYDGARVTVLTAGAELPSGLETKTVAFDEKNQLVLVTGKGVRFADGSLWKPADVDDVLIEGDTVWANCGYFGLFRRRAGKVKKWSLEDGVNAWCLVGDTMFVGNSGGLHRIDGDALTHVGFADDGVEALTVTPDGTLWVNSSSALFSVRADGVIRALDGAAVATSGEPTTDDEVEEPAPPPRKLRPVPTTSFVPEAKVPPALVSALREADVGGLPLLRFVRPAIGVEVGKAAAMPVGASKLGGRPDLASAWPEGDDEPLPFLLQVSLADVTAFDLEGLLPKKGLLSVFCEMVPDELEASAVRFTTAKLQRADWPEALEDRHGEDDFVAQLPEYALSFYGTWTLPSFEYLSRYAALTDAHRETLDELNEALHAKDPKGSSSTRLLGWPVTLQGEILESGDTIVLLQLDGEMKAPKGLDQVFSQWGNGVAHVLMSKKSLSAQQFDDAEAMLAFT